MPRSLACAHSWRLSFVLWSRFRRLRSSAGRACWQAARARRASLPRSSARTNSLVEPETSGWRAHEASVVSSPARVISRQVFRLSSAKRSQTWVAEPIRRPGATRIICVWKEIYGELPGPAAWFTLGESREQGRAHVALVDAPRGLRRAPSHRLLRRLELATLRGAKAHDASAYLTRELGSPLSSSSLVGAPARTFPALGGQARDSPRRAEAHLGPRHTRPASAGHAHLEVESPRTSPRGSRPTVRFDSATRRFASCPSQFSTAWGAT